MTRPPVRFEDPDLPLESYLEVVLVRCPGCDGCARVAAEDEPWTDLFGPRRLTCTACGAVRQRARGRYVTGAPVDPWFEEPLWLQAEVRGQVLWAYNEAHLDLLRRFVAASHRRDDDTHNHLRSVANRLPKWIGLAANRDGILRAIDRLQQDLDNR